MFTRMRRPTLLLTALLALAALAPEAVAQTQLTEPNWDETARKVIPEFESRLIEFTDFLRVYRKGSCLIDITMRISNSGAPATAQVRFTFDDEDGDGRIHEGEMTWKKVYASSIAVAGALQSMRQEFFRQLSLPISRQLRANRVTGQTLPTGYELAFGPKIEDMVIPHTLSLNRDFLVEKGVFEYLEGNITVIPQYSRVGDRVVVNRTTEVQALTNGGEKRNDTRFEYRAQEGCLLPVRITSVLQVIMAVAFTNITTDIRFNGWTLERRPRPLPRLGEAPLRRDPPPVEPPVPEEPPEPTDRPVEPGLDQNPPDRPTPPNPPNPPIPENPPAPDGTEAGAAEAASFLASLERHYLGLVHTGAGGLMVEVGAGSRTTRVPEGFQFAWTTPGSVPAAGFFDDQGGENDLVTLYYALMDNPLLVPFSLIRLSAQARITRMANGETIVTDPGAVQPTRWFFGGNNRLRFLAVGAPGEERVRSYQWMGAGGGLLLVESRLELAGGASIYTRYGYDRYGDLILPRSIEVGTKTAPLPDTPATQDVSMVFTLAGVRKDGGARCPPLGEPVERADPLKHFKLLPGGGGGVDHTGAAPAELSATLDSGMESLARSGKRDVAADLVLVRGEERRNVGAVYWLAPGVLEVETTGLDAKLARIVTEALLASPMLRPFATAFAGATTRTTPENVLEVSTPSDSGETRVYTVAAGPSIASIRVTDPNGEPALLLVPSFSPGQSGRGAMLKGLSLTGPAVDGGARVQYRYTREGGFIFINRLMIEAADQTAGEIHLLNVRVDQGVAAGRLGGEEDLFDD